MRLHLGGEVTPKDIPILGLFFEYAGWWIPAVIVVSFLFAIWRYLRPIWRSSRALARAIRDLDAGANDEMIFQKAPRFLSDLWKDYLQRRRGASVAVSEGTQSTVAPEEVFTEHAVLKSYNRKIAGTLAGIFTGLGILGTFIGLVNGLGTIRSAESQAVLDSVVGMLGGMSTGVLHFNLGHLLFPCLVGSRSRRGAHSGATGRALFRGDKAALSRREWRVVPTSLV